MSDLLKLCLINITRKGPRSLLTVLSIAIGVCSVVLISSLGSAGSGMIDGELTQLGLDGAVVTADSKLTDYRLTGADRDALKQLAGVTNASGLILETGRVRVHGLISDALVWGMDQNAAAVMNLRLLYGRQIGRQDVASGARVCMVDARSAEQYYHRRNIVGKTLSFDCSGVRQSFRVVGVVEAGGSGFQNLVGEYIPTFLYLPDSALRQITGKPGFSQISVKFDTEQPDSRRLRQLIDVVELHTGFSGVFAVQDLSAQNRRLSGALSVVRLTLTAIAGISLVVAALGTATIMSAAVKERTREIGIKKAIGASNGRIMAEFVAESALLSGLGAAGGCCIAAVAVKAAGMMLGTPISLNGALSATAVCIGLGTLFGMVPARQAARLNPIDSLRAEA